MEDGEFTPPNADNNNNNTILDVLSLYSDEAMNQLLYDGFWLEATDDPIVIDTSFRFPTSTTSHTTNVHQEIILEEAIDKSSNCANQSLVYSNTQMDELSGNLKQEEQIIPPLPSASSTQFGGFQIQGTDTNRRLWVEPNRNRAPTTSVKSKLLQAIKYLKESNIDKDVLIQIWIPRKKGGRNILTTDNQLFSLNPNSTSLAEYRRVSRDYQFAAEENSKESVGLPGRVFLNKLPESTPDVRFFRSNEYSRVKYAQLYNVRGSIALPVLDRGSGTCLGVVEIVTTTQRVNYRSELEDICKALEAVDLKSSNVSIHPKLEDCSQSYQAALAEIQNLLKCVCDAYQLPLAQTWAPCTQQGKSGCRSHSDDNYSYCVSIVDSACYVLDPQVQSFHEACSEHHLLKGEGIAGRAFLTNEPCIAMDIKAFSKTEYPLAHHARMFGMCAAIAIRIRSNSNESSNDFVLEFFLPLNCKDAENQKDMLNSLYSVIQRICQGFLRVVTDQELAEETIASLGGQKGNSSSVGKSDTSSLLTSSFGDRPRDASSWFTHTVKAQEKGKGVAALQDSHSMEPEEDEEEEFKVTTMQRNPEMMGRLHMPTFQQDSGSKDKAEGTEELSSIGGQYTSTAKKSGEKRKTKAEKTISLQVLRQHFSGSLKDAAKNIGVCPTTLKRICRTYGIQRWPSRKIKKVGHSLRKVQLVIDSIQGAEGAIQLSSFYTRFPELTSPNMAGTSNTSILKSTDSSMQQSDMQPEVNLLSPGTTATVSPSSSCSHSSSSSFSCPTGATQTPLPVSGGDALSAEQSRGMLKRAQSDVELPLAGHEESNLLVRSQSQKIFTEHASLEALPPFPKPDIGVFKVKASFGEENIRFSLQLHWGFADLQRELLGRFNMDDAGKMYIKYLDDDSEWVLLTCDDDLEECIDIHRSSGSRTIKLSLNRGYPSNRGRLFASSWPS